MRHSFVWTVALALAIVLALPMGCGCRQKIADKVVEKAVESQAKKDGKDVDVKLDSSSGSMTITSKDGQDKVSVKSGDNSFSMQTKDGTMVSGEGAKLPDNFPKDVPVYPGAKVTMSSTMGGDNSFSATFDVTDPMDKVAAFYKKELTANGWTEQQTMNQAGDSPMQMLHYSKEKRMTMVMVSRDGEKTVLSLTTGNE